MYKGSKEKRWMENIEVSKSMVLGFMRMQHTLENIVSELEFRCDIELMARYECKKVGEEWYEWGKPE